jgi:hypothetical protein
MTTYAQIPVARFDYLLGVLNQSPTPPSLLIKKLPGMGVLHMVKTAYPDAEQITVNTLETGTMPEQMLRQALKQQMSKMIILDIDAPECKIEHELCCALRDFMDNGNRLMIVSSGDVTVNDTVLSRMLPTAVI